MPNQQPLPTLQNHFIAGLKTEFTGLNFPENAATDTQNCVYTLIGDVERRGGLNYETNFQLNNINQTSVARSSYRWKNVGGDGQTQMLVEQIGITLYFYVSTNATTASPLSTTLLPSNVNLSLFQANGNVNNVALTECQFADGNGFLIVTHPDCDSFFCTFNPSGNIVTPQLVNFQIRDVTGIPEPGVADNFRPSTLTDEHEYNLVNQGWTIGTNWTGVGTANGGSSTSSFNTSQPNFFGDSGHGALYGAPAVGDSWWIPITSQTNTSTLAVGKTIAATFQIVTVVSHQVLTGQVTATVTTYTAPFDHVIVHVNTTSYTSYASGGDFACFGFFNSGDGQGRPTETVNMSIFNVGFINTWQTAIGNYPSNSDIWWLYKDSTGVFNPGTMITNVQQTQSPAPKGSILLNPWKQQRANISGIASLTDIITTSRPASSCWFSGRVFYAGLNASQQPSGDEPYYTWTENVYFSKIVETSGDFGKCYQINDPTDQNLFAILPSDGGVITIQGSGAIYKLFPLRFGLIVFAANGVWFISGSTGVGFAANDFTVTKISSIESISGTSFIDVQGYPMFWNEEGVYKVVPSQQAGSAHSPDIQLDVQNMTIGTILTYYQAFPLISKKFARGDYDQLNYIVQWAFRSTAESGISNRYTFDTILNLNVVTGAFYPYTISNGGTSSICDIKYIQSPGGTGAPSPVFKYITQIGTNITFSEENDFTHFVDFFSENSAGYNFTSYFVSGYVLPGQGLRKVQIPYLYLFFRESTNTACIVQSIWDFASAGASGKWSPKQLITNNQQNFAMVYRRVRLLGRGMATQVKVSSVPGIPFDIMGWSVWNLVNQGV